jgi:hypothetical protein
LAISVGTNPEERKPITEAREWHRRLVRELRVCPSTAEDGWITQLLVEPAMFCLVSSWLSIRDALFVPLI